MSGWDIAVAIIAIAIVYVLVRPSSQASTLVTAVTDAMTAIITRAADLGAPTTTPSGG